MPRRPAPYLMLVTFGAPRFDAWSAKDRSIVADSPYQGVASVISEAYDTEAVPGLDQLADAVRTHRDETPVDVWPWVFLNRIIGQSDAQRHASANVSPLFRRIQGWDLVDDTGSLSAFYETWRRSLQLARETGSPGIVLDPETYNDYSTERLAVIAERRRTSTEEIAGRIHHIGWELARIVEQEYPNAIIWSLFTRLGVGGTTDSLFRGMLAALSNFDVPAVVVDGGEATVGYYSGSADEHAAKVRNHAEMLAPFTDLHPDRLRVSATLAPYHDPDRLKSWIREASESGGRVYRNAAEFGPLVAELLCACEYVWMYGASAAGYVPFSDVCAETNEAVHAMLREALDARTG